MANHPSLARVVPLFGRRRGPAPAAPERSALAAPLARVFAPIVDLGSGTIAGWDMLAHLPAEAACDAAVHPAGPARAPRVVDAGLDALEAVPRGRFVTIRLRPAGLIAPETIARLDAVPRLDGLVLDLSGAADHAAIHGTLERLRARGLRLALHDTAAGAPSLASILALRPELIRVGPALVEGLLGDPGRTAAMTAMRELAAGTGAAVIADMVPDRATLDALRELGIGMAMGPAAGRPVTAERPPLAQCPDVPAGAPHPRPAGYPG